MTSRQIKARRKQKAAARSRHNTAARLAPVKRRERKRARKAARRAERET